MQVQRLSSALTTGRSLQAFLEYYYNLFSTNRAGLAGLYQDGSMLTFEGQKFLGTQAIMGKLSQLPFAQCKVQPASSDFQPSISGGVIVFVTGHIMVSDLCCVRAVPMTAMPVDDAH